MRNKMKECPNCGYDLDKHLTKSDKKKLKEKARIEKLQREYRNDFGEDEEY